MDVGESAAGLGARHVGPARRAHAQLIDRDRPHEQLGIVTAAAHAHPVGRRRERAERPLVLAREQAGVHVHDVHERVRRERPAQPLDDDALGQQLVGDDDDAVRARQAREPGLRLDERVVEVRAVAQRLGGEQALDPRQRLRGRHPAGEQRVRAAREREHLDARVRHQAEVGEHELALLEHPLLVERARAVQDDHRREVARHLAELARDRELEPRDVLLAEHEAAGGSADPVGAGRLVDQRAIREREPRRAAATLRSGRDAERERDGVLPGLGDRDVARIAEVAAGGRDLELERREARVRREQRDRDAVRPRLGDLRGPARIARHRGLLDRAVRDLRGLDLGQRQPVVGHARAGQERAVRQLDHRRLVAGRLLDDQEARGHVRQLAVEGRPHEGGVQVAVVVGPRPRRRRGEHDEEDRPAHG